MVKRRKVKKINKLILAFSITLVFAILGLFFASIGFHNYEEQKVTYKEENHINYKVYLLPNNFFQEEYLPENMAYITSLINYINLHFSYKIDFNKPLTGTYSYYIKGIVDASQTDSDSKYYTKEYILSDTKTQKYEQQKSIDIQETIDIHYQDYNQILIDFKNEYGVPMDGNLKVALVIQNMVEDQETGENTLKEQEVELNIPLTSATLEVPIETNNQTDEGVLLTNIVKKEGMIYTVSRILSFCFYGIALLLLGYSTYLTCMGYKLESVYQKKLRKILKVYDGIIVNLQKKPVLDRTKVLPVSSFEELIDAHSEVRNPINYINEKDGALFILMSDKYIYYYKLDRELFSKGETHS